MAKITQKEDILHHLLTGKSLSQLEAYKLFGCFRLGARIWELKKEGYDIQREMKAHNDKHYAVYSLKSSAQGFENLYNNVVKGME